MADEKLVISIETQANARSLSSFNKELRGTENLIKTLDKSLKTNGTSYEKLGAKLTALNGKLDTQQAKYKKLEQQLEKQKAKMEAIKNEYDKATQSGENNGKAVEDLAQKYARAESEVRNTENQMRVLSEQIGETTSDIANLNNQLENFERLQLSEHLQAQGKHLQDVGDKWQKMGQSITNTGNGIVKLFAPVEAAGALAVKCAIDFESSWASATKTIDGTDEELQNLQDGLRGLSKEMPTNINDLNELAAAAGQMGIGVNDVKEYVRVMAMLGETTNISADEATTALAQLLNITGGNVAEISNLGSAIVDLGNNLATDEATIVGFAQGIAGVGASANMSEQDILGFSAAMGALGINVEAGSTSFSTFVSKIQLACSDGGESLQKFAQVAGMSSEEFQKAFNENSTDAIMAVVKGMHDYQEAGGDLISLISNLGISETRQRDLLLRLAQGYDIVEDSLGISNKAWAENTALQDEANKRYQTTASQMEMLKNKVYDVGISIGAQLLPVINDMIDKVGDAVEWFSQLDPELSANIIKFSTLATGVGLLTSGFGRLVSGVGGGIKTLGSFVSWIGKLVKPAAAATTAIQGVTTATAGISTAGASAGVISSLTGALSALAPVALPVVGALTAVGAAIVAYKTNFAGFKDTCESVTEDIMRIFNVWKERMMEVFGHIKEGWEEDFGNIRTMLETGWENITTIFETVFDVIENLFDLFADGFEGDWEGVWENVFAITDELFEGFSEAWSNALDTMLEVMDDIFPGIKDKLDFLPDVWKDSFKTIGDVIGEGVENIKLTFEALGKIFDGDFSGAWDMFVDRWKEIWDKVKEILGSTKDWIVEKFTSMVDVVTEFATNFKDGVIEKYEEVKDGVIETFGNMKEGMVNKVEEIKEGVVTKWEEIKEEVPKKVNEMVNSVVTFFSELPYKIAYELGAVAGEIATWCVDVYNYLTTNVPMWIESVGTWFSELPGKVQTWLTDTFERIKTWGTDTCESFKETAKTAVDVTVEWFKQLPGKVQGWLTNTLGNIKTWGVNMVNTARETASNFLNNCINYLSQLPGKVKGKLDEAISKVKAWASDMGNKGREAARNVVNAINQGLASLPGIAMKWGSQLPSRIWSGITGGLSWLKNRVSSMLSGLVSSAINGFKNTFNPGKREHGGKINMPEISYTNEPHGGKTGWELVDGPAMALSSPGPMGTLTYLGEGAAVTSNLTSTAMMMKAVQKEVASSINKLDFSSYATPSSPKSRSLQATTIVQSPSIDLVGLRADVNLNTQTLATLLNILINTVEDKDSNIYMDSRKVSQQLAPSMSIELERNKRRR